MQKRWLVISKDLDSNGLLMQSAREDSDGNLSYSLPVKTDEDYLHFNYPNVGWEIRSMEGWKKDATLLEVFEFTGQYAHTSQGWKLIP